MKCKIFLVLSLLVVCNIANVWAAPGASVLSRPAENSQGVWPEVDGFKDPAVQQKINGQLQQMLHELPLAEGVNYSFATFQNTTNLLSLLVKGEKQGRPPALRSFNVDARTGTFYGLNDFFVANESFYDFLAQELAWQVNENTPFVFTPQAVVFFDSAGKDFSVALEKLYAWYDLGKAHYYVDIYYLTEAADKKFFSLPQGSLVVITLATDKSSGYVWQSNLSTNNEILEYIGSSYLLSTAEIGAKGADLLVFGTKKPGRTSLELEYKRSWQREILKSVQLELLVEN